MSEQNGSQHPITGLIRELEAATDAIDVREQLEKAEALVDELLGHDLDVDEYLAQRLRP